MRKETFSCSAVCSASYLTEPSARRILDSQNPTPSSTGQFFLCSGRANAQLVCDQQQQPALCQTSVEGPHQRQTACCVSSMRGSAIRCDRGVLSNLKKITLTDCAKESIEILLLDKAVVSTDERHVV